ncbi:hypothetical protein [Amycolatopsis sp. lyj-90]|uniref:hypothetical protein n=1 Tax=Amycolatopsis sp. lyj-90 TaxID=2789285 RepID=UPI003978DC36
MRIPWEFMSGDQVEDMIAVALLREHPNGKHIRASGGDGGIDVFIPDPGSNNTGTNYQIKNFNRPLEDPQKAQIRKSLRATEKTTKAGLFKTNRCLVVVPIDPSASEEKWLARHAEKYDAMSVKFFGLSHIMGVLLKYPEVIDYYAHNGREQLNGAVSDLTQVLKGVLGAESEAGNEPLSPNDVVDHLSNIVATINDFDAFYTYSLAVGEESEFEQINSSAIASIAIPAANDYIVTVSIIPRFTEAMKFRPCTFTVRPVPATQEEEQEFADFQRFGTSATFTASYDADLPGGLGAEDRLATVTIGPVLPKGEPRRMRVALLRIDKGVIAELFFSITSASSGLTGQNHYFKLESENKVIRLETRFDRDNDQMSYSFGANDPDGRIADQVRAEYAFLGALGDAHYIRLSRPYGPASKDIQDISGLPPRSDWTAIAGLISDLADIQSATNEIVYIPSLSEIGVDLRTEIHRAATLARGETIDVTWDRLDVHLNETANVDENSDPVTLAAIFPLEIKIQDTTYDLGKKLIHYKIGRFESSNVDDAGNRVAVYVPAGDSAATLRRVADAE